MSDELKQVEEALVKALYCAEYPNRVWEVQSYFIKDIYRIMANGVIKNPPCYPCDKCGGSGFKNEPVEYESLKPTTPCPDCNGTGQDTKKPMFAALVNIVKQVLAARLAAKDAEIEQLKAEKQAMVTDTERLLGLKEGAWGWLRSENQPSNLEWQAHKAKYGVK